MHPQTLVPTRAINQIAVMRAEDIEGTRPLELRLVPARRGVDVQQHLPRLDLRAAQREIPHRATAEHVGGLVEARGLQKELWHQRQIRQHRGLLLRVLLQIMKRTRADHGRGL